MALIKLSKVSRIYDGSSVPVKALSGINLSVNRGEFTSIVGPSGSGKTTLLNIIGGLDTPSSGTVFIEGTDISSFSAGKLVEFRLRHIGFVFQAYNLIPVFTARENIEFIMLLQGRPEAERRARAIELLKAVGLARRSESRPAELSGGEQQRVAVARALASKPSFILADEPTANLDTKTASSLLDIMEELNSKSGTTFIFSTHDPRVIARAGRVITLQDGKIIHPAKRKK